MDAAVQAAGVRTRLRLRPALEPAGRDGARRCSTTGCSASCSTSRPTTGTTPSSPATPAREDHLQRMDASAMLGGGCHAVDLARYLMGSDIVEVSALAFTGDAGRCPSRRTRPRWSASPTARPARSRPASSSGCPTSSTSTCSARDGGLRDNRFYSRKLPGVTDWATFPTILPNSGAGQPPPVPGRDRPLPRLHPRRRREPRQPARRGQHPRGLLRDRPLERRRRGAGPLAARRRGIIGRVGGWHRPQARRQPRPGRPPVPQIDARDPLYSTRAPRRMRTSVALALPVGWWK